MSEFIDFKASAFGEFRQSALLERNPSEFPAISMFGAFGSQPTDQVHEVHSHPTGSGFTFPGHIHRASVPDYLRMRIGSGQGYAATLTGPSPFINPLPIPLTAGPSNAYYRLNLRVRGIAELIPWNDDDSPVIMPVGRWMNPVGYLFLLTGNMECFHPRKFRYKMPDDWYAIGRTDIDSEQFGIVANSESEGTGTAVQGARMIDRMVSFSVRSDRVSSVTLSVVSSIWTSVAPSGGSDMYVGGTLGDGDFNLPAVSPFVFTPSQIGQPFGASGAFWAQQDSANPPSLAFPHNPMLIPTIAPNDQIRLEVMLSSAFLEDSARPEEYIDLL